jgi:hypothetical protein
MHCTAKRARATYLLHDTGLALGEGDVSARLVLDELDLDLSALAAGLVIVVVVVIGCRARSLNTATGIALLQGAIVAIGVVVDRGRRVLVVLGDFGGHGGCWWNHWLRLFLEFGSPKLLAAGRCCVGSSAISSLEGASLVDGSARYRRVQVAGWERLDPK